MECNKDDAIRAKEVAEKKLLEKDIVSAKRFASKAHSLFPGLEGLSQFQEILDVYVASARNDWYGIIGVDPLANYETIRNRYKKLALSLHPDRNKCIGAEGAFKFLSDAFSFLSDKAKKSAYDQKVSRAGAMKNSSKKARISSSSSKYPAPTHDNIEKGGSGLREANQRTFWTSCSKCNMRYEYLIIYLNRKLVCPNCSLPFLAKEMPPPSSTWPTNHLHPGVDKRFKTTSYVKRKLPSSSMTGGAKRLATKSSDSFKNNSQNVSRVLENGQNSKRCVNEQSASGPLEMNNVLMGLAQVEILKKINRVEDTVESRISPVSLLKTEFSSEIVPDPNEPNWSSIDKITSVSITLANEITMAIEPEFYDFDKDRSEESFCENQVWALYDAKEGLPRYYALIHGLISNDPIKVQISWLNINSDCDLTWLKWFNCGLPQIYGDFRVRKSEVLKNLVSFSHRVKFSKLGRGLIRIYPKKGDAWILYRNWCSDWNELTLDDVIRQYDLVEVLEDYNEEHGVLVVPLVKVAGFKSVFHPNLDPRTIYTIPKDERFRFSHQVPSYTLKSEDDDRRYLKGCLELDPAAMPREFLELNRESEEEEVKWAFEGEDIVMLDEVSEGNRTSDTDNADCVAIETVEC